MVNDTVLHIDGKDYKFEKDGICVNKIQAGWMIDCNYRWYYFDENGVMLNNTTVNENQCDENGVLIKPESNYISDDPNQYPGWFLQDNKWHCKLYGEDLISFWLWTGNDKWFYFDN